MSVSTYYQYSQYYQSRTAPNGITRDVCDKKVPKSIREFDNRIQLVLSVTVHSINSTVEELSEIVIDTCTLGRIVISLIFLLLLVCGFFPATGLQHYF